MSEENKSICPVCYTKMRTINRIPTCPECGYKYCDHCDDRENMFDTEHTHQATYVTYNQPKTTTNVPQVRRTADSKQTVTVTPTGKIRTTNSKVIKIIVIIFIAMYAFPFIIGIITMFIGFFLEALDNRQGAYTQPEMATVAEEPQYDYITAYENMLTEIDTEACINVDTTNDTFTPALLEYLFDVEDCSALTYGEINDIGGMYIYYHQGSMYASCSFYSGNYDSFEMEGATWDSANLKNFIGLNSLYCDEVHLETGDLDNLSLLTDLACNNTPAELIEIIDPLQLTYLQLTLPEGTTSLLGIERFQNLHTLLLDASLAQVSEVSSLPVLSVNLHCLYYADNGSLNSYDFLKRMNHLESLSLHAPTLTDISFVEDIYHLKEFEVHDAAITDLSPLLKHSRELTLLDLSDCTLLYDFSCLEEFNQLRNLYLDNCNIDNLDFASDMSRLTYLSIKNTNVTSLEPLKDLPKLDSIATGDSPIEDYAGLKDICSY